MHEEPTLPAERYGPAIAAMYGAMLGLLVMALANVATEASGDFEDSIIWLRGWIPGSASMGAYPAKETIGLLVWLISWPILHLVLRERRLPFMPLVLAFLVGVGISTILIWPPVIHAIIGG